MRCLTGTLLLMILCGPLSAQELQPALSARSEFTDMTGAQLVRPEPGVPFEVTVTIENRSGVDPPGGLQLAGWIRPVEEGNLSCTESARSFLVSGRLPRGAVKMNGAMIGVASEDGSFTIADPDIDLASANLVGATRLTETPASLVADVESRRFLATLLTRGELLSIAVPSASITVLATGLDQPGAVHSAPDGSIWVLETGKAQLRHIGDHGSQIVASGVKTLGPSPTGDVLATAGPSGAALLDTVTGVPTLTVEGRVIHALPLADGSGTFALATLSRDEITITYTDAPENPVTMKLPSHATRLAAGPGGRWILAHDPSMADPVMLVDVGRGRVIQSIATPGAISEIAFTDRAAYLMTANQSQVGILELGAIRMDQPSTLRQVALGQPQARQLDHSGYLMPLWPQPGMIAVHAESFTGFIIHDYSVMGDAPPMSAIRLRGGVPRMIAGIDRSFREIAPGVFRTTAMLPRAGRFELVTTTGIGALSFCALLPATEDAVTEKSVAPGRLRAEQVKGAPGRVVRLSFRSDDGVPVAKGQFDVRITGLASPWRDATVLTTDAAGNATRILALPVGGPVAISARSSDGRPFHPLVLEER